MALEGFMGEKVEEGCSLMWGRDGQLYKLKHPGMRACFALEDLKEDDHVQIDSDGGTKKMVAETIDKILADDPGSMISKMRAEYEKLCIEHKDLLYKFQTQKEEIIRQKAKNEALNDIIQSWMDSRK